MAWRWPVRAWASGDYITPDEMMDEFANYIAEMNGRIDRDNIIVQGVPGDALVRGAVERMGAVHGSLATAIGAEYTHFLLFDGTALMPDMSTVIETGDSALVLRFTLGAYSNTLGPEWGIGILLDGEMVATDELRTTGNTETLTVKRAEALVQVGAGLHLIQPVFLATGAVYWLNERRLFWREQRR